jgi:hypothetical protein
MDINPYQPPSHYSDKPANSHTRSDVVLVVARSQRAMMCLMAVEYLLLVGHGMTIERFGLLGQIGFWIAFVAVGIAVIYFVFRLAEAMYGIGPAIVSAILSVPPFLGALTVLALNGYALDYLRKKGVKSNFMGLTAEQLRELETNTAKAAKEKESAIVDETSK